ncbi:MAG: hypothetical protein QOD93_3145 [Acetobacteraceae bacterium]|jgi:hypothetical protein|nr:hypothetical protein [Rhodopila sp.]MEA2770183.1 hypothetical protein [Acetobacteraceae bacterium]
MNGTLCRTIVSRQFLNPRSNPSCLRSQFKYLISGLNPLFRFQNT